MKISGKIAEKGFHAFDDEPRSHAGIGIPRLWVVTADRKRAHVYRKTPEGLERIADIKAGLDQNGQPEEGLGVVHHGYDVKSAGRNHDDGAFIRQLTAWLDTAVRENAFDRLILAAAPHALGDIRTCLSKSVRERIIMETDKDFTRNTGKELEDRLYNIMLSRT